MHIRQAYQEASGLGCNAGFKWDDLSSVCGKHSPSTLGSATATAAVVTPTTQKQPTLLNPDNCAVLFQDSVPLVPVQIMSNNVDGGEPGEHTATISCYSEEESKPQAQRDTRRVIPAETEERNATTQHLFMECPPNLKDGALKRKVVSKATNTRVKSPIFLQNDIALALKEQKDVKEQPELCVKTNLDVMQLDLQKSNVPKERCPTPLPSLAPIKPPTPKTVIRCDDVLCHSTGQDHLGNKRYREIIGRLKSSYSKARTFVDKLALVRRVMDEIKQNGGRFLKRDSPRGRWKEVSDSIVVWKTSEALRLGIKTCRPKTMNPPRNNFNERRGGHQLSRPEFCAFRDFKTRLPQHFSPSPYSTEEALCLGINTFRPTTMNLPRNNFNERRGGHQLSRPEFCAFWDFKTRLPRHFSPSPYSTAEAQMNPLRNNLRNERRGLQISRTEFCLQPK